MKQSEFAKLLDKIQEEEREVRAQGQKEYAHDEENSFRNFDIVGDLLKCPHCHEKIGPQTVLMVYKLKHVFGIIAHVNGERSQREDVRGRLKDDRLYSALLWGMEEGGEKKWETVPDPTPRPEHTTTLEDMAEYFPHRPEPPARVGCSTCGCTCTICMDGHSERQVGIGGIQFHTPECVERGVTVRFGPMIPDGPDPTRVPDEVYAAEGEGGPELFDREVDRYEGARDSAKFLRSAFLNNWTVEGMCFTIRISDETTVSLKMTGKVVELTGINWGGTLNSIPGDGI